MTPGLKYAILYCALATNALKQLKRKTKNNFFISILINFIVDNYHEKADIKENHRDMANTEKSKKPKSL